MLSAAAYPESQVKIRVALLAGDTGDNTGSWQRRTCFQYAICQAPRDGGQVGHNSSVAVPAQAQQLIVLAHHVGGNPAEVERDGCLVCMGKQAAAAATETAAVGNQSVAGRQLMQTGSPGRFAPCKFICFS
jgi:hypothetical protein